MVGILPVGIVVAVGIGGAAAVVAGAVVVALHKRVRTTFPNQGSRRRISGHYLAVGARALIGVSFFRHCDGFDNGVLTMWVLDGKPC